MFDLITVAQMFIYSALFIRGRMFLCADKQSSVCFADVRRIAAGASEFISCGEIVDIRGRSLILGAPATCQSNQ